MFLAAKSFYKSYLFYAKTKTLRAVLAGFFKPLLFPIAL